MIILPPQQGQGRVLGAAGSASGGGSVSTAAAGVVFGSASSNLRINANLARRWPLARKP